MITGQHLPKWYPSMSLYFWQVNNPSSNANIMLVSCPKNGLDFRSYTSLTAHQNNISICQMEYGLVQTGINKNIIKYEYHLKLDQMIRY